MRRLSPVLYLSGYFVCVAADAGGNEGRAQAGRGPGRRVRVFLCDDSAPLRALMRAALPDEGLVVVGEAPDGASVVAGVLTTSADAVLLDLTMPGGDGLTALKALRKAAPACTVVIFSTFDAATVAECRALGAHACIEKGAAVDAVRCAIRRAVAAPRAERGTSCDEDPPPPAGGSSEVL